MVYVYKETRVSLDWASDDRIVEVAVPDYDAAEAAAVEENGNDTAGVLITGETDDFPLGSLASSSSIVFRAIHQTPRTILWRVVNKGRTLVMLPLDVARSNDQHLAVASAYKIQFSRAIVSGCVTFYDLPETHSLMIFVLTAGNHLYTFNLHQSFFTSHDEGDRLHPGWCHVFQPPSLAVRCAHFLRAVSEDSLLVALQDGNLIRLDRLIHQKSSSGYKEITFSDGGYFGSIKSIVRWGGAQVRYGDNSIAASTVVSVAMTFRYSLLFTVSINHQLKVWSMERGTMLGTYDLLNEPASNAPSIKNYLDPAPAHLVALIEDSPDPRYMFLLLTLSPAGSGTFKLWAATDDGTAGFTRLVDLYPDEALKLEPPTFNTLWVVADFGIASFSKDDPSLISMWLLWKSNTSSRLQTVTFKIDDMPRTFGNWVDASQEQLLLEKPRSPPGGEIADLSSYWLDWIFQPGRFSDSVIDRAVEIFKKNFISKGGRSTDLDKPSSNDSRHGLVLSAVNAVVSLRNIHPLDAGMDTEDALWRDYEVQWNTFFRICTELDRTRVEALSLNIDPASGLAFVANADTITVVRKSSESETISQNLSTATTADIQRLYQNSSEKGKALFGDGLVDSVKSLILAARELNDSLSPTAFDECVAAFQDEVTRPPDVAIYDRIDGMYDRCFEGRVPQSHLDHVAGLVAALQHDPERAFRVVLSSITQFEPSGSSNLTVFGEKLLLRGSQEVIHVNYTLLFELTLLLILVHCSTIVEIDDIEPYNKLYLDLVALLREYNILSWLSKNSWTPTPEDVETEQSLRTTLGLIRGYRGQALPQIHNFPTLQILLKTNGGPPPSAVGSGPVTLTSSIQKFLAATELGQFSEAVTLIASRLLRMNAIRLMGEFMPYLPPTPWGDYLKARMAVCRKEWKTAEELFQSAAPGIAAHHHIAPVNSLTALFTPVELEYLCSGTPRYYFHVAEIFEHRKQYGEVVVFSELAFKALPNRLDQEETALRSDILARQFSAALQVPNYQSAYSALMSYSDKALQRQALKSLVVSMCEHNQADTLCQFEFSGLHEEVDAVLERQYEQLNEVASVHVPYHKIAYAWRILKGNRRGAASAQYDHLKKLQGCLTNSQRFTGKEVREAYLALLNILALVPKEEAYIFTRLHAEQESSGVHFVDGKKLRRRVVSIDNIREEFQEEMRRTIEYLSGGIFF
ncbi:hypothetical protein TWF173_007387 [Orbilia oligospora]|nr:hypothetical protein TWF173_007387 [Orbilia oligospora]